MTKSTEKQRNSDPRSNYLLAKLIPADYNALIRVAKVTSLKLRQRLYDQDGPIETVCFPLDCMFSMLVSSRGKPPVEVALIGNNGVVGASELIQRQGSMGRMIVQLPGTVARIGADAFKRLLDSCPSLVLVIHEHFFALMRQVMFTAACNRLHSTRQRSARWLLMTHDHAARNDFPLTQEFLSHMLGVRRATVNAAILTFKKAGLLRYVRGKMTIVDRKGLEAASCDCYNAIAKSSHPGLSNARELGSRVTDREQARAVHV